MIPSLLLLVVLIVLSAFFSGSEIALFSLGEARVRMMVEEGRRGARALAELKANPERLLSTILIGNNIVNIGGASVATALALEHFGSQGVAFATGAMTLLVLVFGEITPKGLATANADSIALAVAPPIRLLSRVMFPVVYPFEALTRKFVSRGQREGRLTVTEGEIREMTAIGHSEGSIDEHERRIIDRAFHLDDTRVWDIMTPRVDVFAWPATRRISEIATELYALRFSRIPVYGSTIDDIIGVLYIRDAYQALIAGQRDVTLGELAREPLFVPGSITLTRLLSEFQARRIHMGVVIDEYGGTDGLVTLEDILEELVGEINDETDLELQPIIRISRNEVLVEGSADLREVNHFFNTSFPQLEHRTLNGYLLDELGRVPEVGEEIERENVRIHIVEATETQVLRARLSRLGTADSKREAGESVASKADRDLSAGTASSQGNDQAEGVG